VQGGPRHVIKIGERIHERIIAAGTQSTPARRTDRTGGLVPCPLRNAAVPNSLMSVPVHRIRRPSGATADFARASGALASGSFELLVDAERRCRQGTMITTPGAATNYPSPCAGSAADATRQMRASASRMRYGSVRSPRSNAAKNSSSTVTRSGCSRR
jgi:hypothetical protein